MTPADYIRRNKKIYEMYLNRMTMTAIGARFHISRERVRQIIRRLEKDV
jgi:DNA-directed RNA polymerase sigma subunit (sigma70/sigma32)